MKTIRSNKRLVYYRKYLGMLPIKDSDGYETGEHEPQYGRLKTIWANVTAGKGEKVVRDFGGSEEYDRKLIVKDTDLEPNDVLWVGKLPWRIVEGRPVSQPYNYLVVSRPRGLNHDAVLIRKVRVDG